MLEPIYKEGDTIEFNLKIKLYVDGTRVEDDEVYYDVTCSGYNDVNEYVREAISSGHSTVDTDDLMSLGGKISAKITSAKKKIIQDKIKKLQKELESL